MSAVQGSDRLRVATYNTRDLLDDRRAAVAVVRALEADVLCLQEVPRRLFGPTRLRRFAQACGMRWTGRHTGSGGTTVLLSPRVELVAASHHRLPVRWPDRTRGWAQARVRLPGGAELTAVSVHLGLRAAERTAHVRRVLERLGPGPTVVAGDLNEGPDGDAYRLLTSRLAPVGPNRPTYPARAPRRRLDVILAAGDVRFVGAPPVEVPDALWARASDHRAAWADIAIGGGGATVGPGGRS
ncbi:endonuclease/exonuclease/phosphatase family protein [Phycicoccus sp. BSK3Z-2]|uniref:Endonuclease/exonuclease/phosphatase family protein n=1 Tax=Phycicoccus avicenniae TaxID=2828860 RepID=A0A941DB35_9MICO|nr:endonuclease/exonuclease/phosphatase family protein [Phycicoccus avicenniae]MBR7743142.1 endonuclease/exonuclease/phosphatase family protein [Phycicoccus avicenniae]